MTYLVRGCNSWGEFVHEQSCHDWEAVKETFDEFVGDDCHPSNIEIFECTPIKFTVDFSLIVEPARV